MKADGELAQFNVLPDRSRYEVDYKLRGMLRLARAFRRELFSDYRLPIAKSLKVWRLGFSAKAWILYDLDNNDPNLYLNDLAVAIRAPQINGYFGPVISNKLVLSHLLSRYGIPHPPVLYTVVRGRLMTNGGDSLVPSRETLKQFMETARTQVFRPMWSGGGAGVFFVTLEDNDALINGQRISMSRLTHILSRLDNYLVTEFQKQAAYCAKIFPDSTNTLRLLTLWDPQTERPFVAASAHRFGTSRSAPLDNFHQGSGGVCAPVQLHNGELGHAASIGDDGRILRLTHHPQTGVAIHASFVDGFHEAVQGVLEIARRLPFCPCIGWDVILTDDGYRVIEANPLPGYWVWQVHGPLLADPRTRAFYRRWGMASGPSEASIDR